MMTGRSYHDRVGVLLSATRAPASNALRAGDTILLCGQVISIMTCHLS